MRTEWLCAFLMRQIGIFMLLLTLSSYICSLRVKEADTDCTLIKVKAETDCGSGAVCTPWDIYSNLIYLWTVSAYAIIQCALGSVCMRWK